MLDLHNSIQFLIILYCYIMYYELFLKHNKTRFFYNFKFELKYNFKKLIKYIKKLKYFIKIQLF